MENSKEDKLKKYHFLHSHVAKEPHIYEVLDEINRIQKEFLTTYEGKLATLEDLKKSKNIKIKFSPARDKNIFQLVSLLRKNYPDEVKSIITYSFNADTSTKKLSIVEKMEYSINLSSTENTKIQSLRDKDSIESLLELVSKYRFFNLTKLQQISREKVHMAQLIKSEIGNNIFTFKFHTLDRNNLESTEDFCFHKQNYDAVVKSLKIQFVQKIISNNTKHIMARLKKFGILSTTFNDYRDNKLDYLLNILLDDISSFLGEKELLEIKNFSNLRKCLIDFDQVVDPIITIGNDIVKHIRESEISTKSELIGIFDNLPDDSLTAWAKENIDKYKILSYTEGEETYFIDSIILFTKLADLNKQILYNKDKFSNLEHSEKQKKLRDFKILCNLSKKILVSNEQALKIFNSSDHIEKVKKIIEEFNDYQKRISIKSELKKEKETPQRKDSFITIIINLLKSIFGMGSSTSSKKKKSSTIGHHGTGSHNQVRISNDSKEIYKKIIKKESKIIPLSDYLEISSDNDITIDSIINELREKKKKIVIPIYNARDVLYPNRSQHYLISDMEYLIVDSNIAQTGDSIREFTDSLRGHKLKNEKIPSSAIISIEKYLLTLFRQNKKKTRRDH